VYEDRYRKVAGTWYFARRTHRLFYGAEVGTNPLGLPPANWPERHQGWGTLPSAWNTWGRFWASSDDATVETRNGQTTYERDPE
jgi:hypothetical protein